MKIGFWNVNKNSGLADIVVEFAVVHKVDLLVLFESSLDPATMLGKLNKMKTQFHYYSSYSSGWLQIFTAFSTKLLIDLDDEFRISAKQFQSPLGEELNFVFLHFPSKLYFEEDDQDAQAAEIKSFIDEVERKTNSDRTVVLGDFNMNPFQKGMIQTTGLHSTFDKQVAKKGSRVVKEKLYKYFYNPMWSFYGEFGRGSTNGTYHLSSAKPICYYWNIFDQVLFRPSLLSSVFDESSLNIVTKIGKVSLIKKGIVDAMFSDHLPVEFEINI